MAGSYPLSRRPGGGPASLMSPGARAVLPLADPSGGQHDHTHTHNNYNGEEEPAP